MQQHNYAYMQFSVANIAQLTEAQCEALHGDIAVAIADILAQYGLDDETSTYIMDKDGEPVY